jgi:hypothetical protein
MRKAWRTLRGRVAGIGVTFVLACGGRAPSTGEDAAESKEDPEPEASTRAAAAEIAVPQVRTTTRTDVREDPVTLELRPLSVGDAYVERVELATATRLEIEGARREISLAQERHAFSARVEIVEAEDDGPTVARVVYTLREDQDRQDDKPTVRAIARPVQGRAYRIVRKGKDVRAELDDGASLDVREAMVVADANFAFAQGRFRGLLPTGTLEPGHVVTLAEDRVAPLFEARPRRGQTVRHATLTYRGLADEAGTTVAIFDLDVAFETLEGVLRVVRALRGELAYDPRTGALVRATCEGPVELKSETGAHGGASLAGHGALTYDASVELQMR